jgi:hypothetical protein
MRFVKMGLLIVCTAIAIGLPAHAGADQKQPSIDTILLASSPNDVAGCAFVSQKQTASYWGGIAMTGHAYNQVIAKMKKIAIGMGGTHVLIVNLSNTPGGSNLIANIYKCDQASASQQTEPVIAR